MRNPRVCISVTGRSCSEFLDRFAEAASAGELVELRFDTLEPSELDHALEQLLEKRANFHGTLIGTYRSSGNGQGGARAIPIGEREKFWRDPRVRKLVDWVDVEIDISSECLSDSSDEPFSRVIRSHHDFARIPEPGELRRICADLANSGSGGVPLTVKLACVPDDISDSAQLFDLLPSEHDLVVAAMGQFGIWTRILGPVFGSFLTYASTGKGAESAPGQISVGEMEDLYRIRKIGVETRVYGILGRSAIHSLSPYLHNPAFGELEIDAVYLPLPAKDAARFFREMVDPGTRRLAWNLCGLSVTHPHKETVAGLVDELAGNASSIGAVNTVVIADGRSTGYNTDADGFVAPLKRLAMDFAGLRFGIVGTGGAAKAAASALRKEGSDIVFLSRDPSRSRPQVSTFGADVRRLDGESTDMQGIDVLVNASPIGSRGEYRDMSPLPAPKLENLSLVYDMVYNPQNTRLLMDAGQAGIKSVGGLEMLVEQALLQFRIWTGKTAPRKTMFDSAAKRLAEYED